MFTDERRCTVWDEIRQLGLRAFAKLLPPAVFREAAQAAGVTLRNSPLNWANMVWLGLAAALDTGKSFADILVVTFKLLEDAAGWSDTPLGRASKSQTRRGKRRSNKHNPYGQGKVTVSEEAFVQARQRMPMEFWLCLLLLLGERFQAEHPKYVRWKCFRLLALDGTEILLPSWKSLKEFFGTSSNGRRRRRPQARMVMLAFPLARVPWRYELVPRSCHEQTAAARLLRHLQPNDLVLMDRGFWSFGLFCLIQQRGAFFALRLRRGVKMKKVRKLGPDDFLMEWKPAKRSRKRCAWKDWPDLAESLELRVVRYRIRGFRPTAVVTNVLDPKLISREEWVRMATVDEAGRVLDPGLYHRRWEIETLFCELKVRQGMEKSLRGRTPQAITFEVAGHVLLYCLTRWLMVEAAEEHGVDALRISFTQASRELLDMRQTLLTATPQRAAQVLLPRLKRRIAEHLVPLRPGRHYPRPADRYKKGKYRQAAKLVTSKT
jgi:hypothetical protein